MSTARSTHRTDALNLNPTRTRSWAKETASDIIDHLQSDHRFCANCFTRLRDVEPPRDGRNGRKPAPDCAIGFAYPTPDTIPGVDLKQKGNTRRDCVYTGKRICQCGVTNHTTTRRPLRKHTAIQYARQLSQTINDIRTTAQSGSSREYERVDAWRHSTHALVTAMKTLKSNPDHQDASKPLFQAALATSLLHPHQ